MLVPKKYALIGFYLGLFLLLASSLGSAQTTYTRTETVSVTGDDNVGGEHDGFPYPSILNVAGAGTVNTITVELTNLTAHGYNDSSGTGTIVLGVLLESPDGRYLEILGNPSTGGQSLSNLTLTISDSASTAMPDQNSTWPATSNTTLAYRPSSYAASGTQTYTSPGPGALTAGHRSASQGTGTLANIFTGATVNGDWKLFLIDNTGGSGDLISITGWKITITAAATTPTTTTLSSNLNPSWTTAPNNSVTLTATVTPNPGGGTVNFLDGVTTISGCGAVAVSSGTDALRFAIMGAGIQPGDVIVTAIQRKIPTRQIIVPPMRIARALSVPSVLPEMVIE